MIHGGFRMGLETAIKLMDLTMWVLDEVLKLAEEELLPERVKGRIDELKMMQQMLLRIAQLTQAALEG